MDRQTIRERAELILNEPSGGFWSDTDFNSIIQDGEEDVALRTKCLKTYASFTTSVDTCEYDFSESSLANFIDVAEVWYFTDTDIYTELVRVTRDELSMIQSGNRAITATPAYYCYEDRVMEFDCLTEADKTVRVYYHKLPTTMTDDTDVPQIPTKFHQAIVYYTCWKHAESDGLDANRVSYFKNQYFEELAKMMGTLLGNTHYGVIDDTEMPHYAR